MIAQQSALSRIAEDHSGVADAMERLRRDMEHSHSALAAFTKHTDMLRAALGPSEDLKRILQEANTSHSALAEFERMSASYAERFTLPTFPNIAELVSSRSVTEMAIASIVDPHSGLRGAIEAMNTPWLNMKREMESLEGFSALQNIVSVLNKTALSFDDRAQL